MRALLNINVVLEEPPDMPDAVHWRANGLSMHLRSGLTLEPPSRCSWPPTSGGELASALSCPYPARV